MLTPELIQYIRSQLASGQAREVISSNLSAQGWLPQDINEAFNTVLNPAPATANPISQSPNPNPITNTQPPIVAKKGWTLGRIIFWLFIIGFLGILATGAFGAYYAYHNISTLPDKICSDSSPKDQANCRKMVQNFFGFLMKNAQQSQNYSENNGNNISGTQDNNGTGCSTGFSDSGNESAGIGDISAFVGVNDPLLCYYSQPTDLTGISKIVIDINGTKNDTDTVRIVSETNNKKVTVTNKDGKTTTFEADASSPIFAGINGVYLDAIRLTIPLLQFCIKSTNWNVNGSWFNCDKVTVFGVTTSDDDPSNDTFSAVKIYEADTGFGKMLFLETRNNKNGIFSINSMQVEREGRLMKSLKTLSLSDYKGEKDLMVDKTIEQIITQNPSAVYSETQFTYEK